MAELKKTVAAPKVEDPKVTAARERLASLQKSGTTGQRAPGQFLKETIRELKMTTWPDKKTLQKSTSVVLAFIVATAVSMGILDAVLTKVTGSLISR